MKLKVCGMTELNQLQTLEELRVDFAGLIFYEGSKRYVGDKVENQKSEIRNLKISKVGVFVNPAKEEIAKAVDDYGLSLVQLHGDESPEFCREVQQFVPVIKAIRISEATDLEVQLDKFEIVCDYFLFDTDSKQYGGSGKKFNWEILQLAKINKPFFLSGGIGLQDTEEVKAFHHPMLFAIDVNSKFETSPGVKDLKQVESFLKGIN
jgi:phosphoribosylanthranilate isomerase